MSQSDKHLNLKNFLQYRKSQNQATAIALSHQWLDLVINFIPLWG
jgi:hypothetical protein